MFGRRKAQLVFGDPIKPVNLKAKKIKIGRDPEKFMKTGEKTVYDFYGKSLKFKNTPVTSKVSENHCIFTWDKNRKRYLITDTSKFGTWKIESRDGKEKGELKRLRSGKNYVLNHGDIICLGNKEIKLEILYPKRFLF
jgi:hypothetical protein